MEFRERTWYIVFGVMFVIACDYINEHGLVQRFIEETMRRTIIVNGEQRRWFVWGVEIWLPEGGNDGFSGSLDLIATDDIGQVWLVEAKLRTNPELSKEIWTRQLLPYRYGLSRLSPDTINRRSRRYLLNQGAIKTSSLSLDYKHLYDAFLSWVKDNALEASIAKELYNKTLNSIKNETVICTVLADIYDSDVWQARPQDGKPYAYIYANSREAGLEVNVVYNGAGQYMPAYSQDFAASVREWEELSRNKQEVKPTPQSVEIYLTNEAAVYYRECIKRLKALGWDGKYHSNSKAFITDLPTIYGPPIRLHLGWVDFDARVPMKNRLPGELGLKFNVDFRHFKKAPQRELEYTLARRLAQEANYNGRGKGLNIKRRDLTEEEKESWDWEMYRQIDSSNRDYLGNLGEEKDFEAAWAFLYQIIGNGARR